MLAAFMTSRVHCSKQARSCLRSPAVQAENFVPPTSSLFSGGELCLHLHFSLDFAAGICVAYFSPFVDRAIVKRSGLMLVSISRREVGAF